MPDVLILTGPGGSGKTTIGKMLEEQHGYAYLDGDREDTAFFPNGRQWLPEHAESLSKAHEKILRAAKELHDRGKNVVVDYIIFGRYLEFFEMFRKQFNGDLRIKVLMPSKTAMMKRDRERECWTTGEDRIAAVSKEFLSIRDAIGEEHFIDSTAQTPEKTLRAVLS